MKEQEAHDDGDVQLCYGGRYCLKLQDKEHLTQFIHIPPKNFEESIWQCYIAKNPSLILEMISDWNENEIPDSVSMLTQIQKFQFTVTFGWGPVLNVNALASLQNRLQTCIIDAQFTPNLDDKRNVIYTLTNLRYLKLNTCEISEIDNSISQLTLLQTLLIPLNSSLTKLPTSMAKLTSLHYLSLIHTDVRSDIIASVVCKLPSLRALELDQIYRLEKLPSEICQLTALQYLSLSGCENITSLPTQLALLTQLHTLNLDQCQSLKNVPIELGCLKNLTKFIMSITQTKGFPLETLTNWSKLQVLVLDELNIDTVPSQLWMMKELRKLVLCDNKLSSLPSDISQLSNLTYFDVSSNRITLIPNEMTILTQLQSLHISKNPLTEFPGNISSFLHLSQLLLSNINLREIPKQLPPNLVCLNLSMNWITSIVSTTLFSLSRLESLFLHFNRITIVPTEIRLLTALQELFLDFNMLSFIPSDLNSLSNLVYLNVCSNELAMIIPINLKPFQIIHCASNPLKYPPNAVLQPPLLEEFLATQNELYATS
jgi:Leucine-rich repeat (LRR) protein